MSVEGLCAICDEPSVDHSCDHCGQLVCSDHYDATTGYCVECVAELGGPAGAGEADDRPDDVDTYQF